MVIFLNAKNLHQKRELHQIWFLEENGFNEKEANYMIYTLMKIQGKQPLF
jgi:hypothetical protein